MTDRELTGFPNPFEIPTPPGAEGWERMYPYYATFSEDRRNEEEKRFWFFDSMHYPEPVYPFDLLFPEHTWVVASQNITRVFAVPTALGLDHRVLNGYVYVSPNVITDPAEIERRAAIFTDRAGFYFEHWPELYDKWVVKALACITELKEISFQPLPELEPDEVVREGQHLTSGFHLYKAYNRLLENHQEMDYLHFEMLGLGYGAYLTLLGFCKKAFPSIEDQTVAKMVMGIEVLLFRPNEELRKLAALAVELELTEAFAAEDDEPETVLAKIKDLPNGDQWLETFASTKEEWFWFSTGHGVSHHHAVWMTDLSVPFSALKNYVDALGRDESTDRPRGGPGGAGPGHERVPGAAGLRRRPGHLRRSDRSCPHGVRVRGGPRLLLRASALVDLLDQGPRARSGVRASRLPRGFGGHLLPSPLGGVPGDVGPADRMGGDQYRPARLLAARGGRTQADPRGAPELDSPAGARDRARAHHRAVHDHVVGYHPGDPGALADTP